MRVLVIEDNKDLLELVGGLLTDQGYKVTCMDNLADAMQYFKGGAPAPVDVIFTDYALKGATSEKLVELMKEKMPGARIIMTSADVPHMKKSMEPLFAGKMIDAVIAKPYNFNVLLNLVREFGEP